MGLIYQNLPLNQAYNFFTCKTVSIFFAGKRQDCGNSTPKLKTDETGKQVQKVGLYL